MNRSTVPTQFVSQDRATDKQVAFIQGLLDERNLFASTRWFDMVNAMDHEEYKRFLADYRNNEVPKLTRQKASILIERLLALPRAEREAAPAKLEVPSPSELPAGHYAIESDEGELRFYHVWRGSRQPMFVKLYVEHGPESSEVPFKSALTIINKIVAAGAFECSTRYGHEIGSCGVCGLRLTNTLSRELGIGPVCGGRYFEERPDAWKSLKASARETIRERGEDPSA